MLTRQEMDTLVGKTLIILDFPHICLAAGDDALLLLQIAVKDESFIRKGQPIKYIVAHYPEFQGDKLVWGRENTMMSGHTGKTTAFPLPLRHCVMPRSLWLAASLVSPC